ncbi:MAG: phosphoribosylglycinamide formyltransferase [Thermaerobacter sp.]|nr:phosphoribosylglycinamide formyltransferase [Thermaerobacter sp.]
MRIAVLASGRGSNFARLLEEQAAGGGVPYQIVLLGVDRNCPAAETARTAGLALYSAAARLIGMAEWERGFLAQASALGVEGIVLAGFMRILSPQFIASYRGRILNIHPSLLPAFPGRDAIGQALRHGVRQTGVTVHFVDETLDGGPIVLQEAVPVLAGDDEASLAQRIHVVEHRLLPQAVRLLAQHELQVTGRTVTILEG